MMFVRGFRRFLYRLDNVRVRLIFYAILMLVYIFVVLRLRECGLLPLYSGDEHYYISVGLKYVAGVPPIKANFEHPPLAKYVIGFCESVGLGHICSAISVYLGCVGVSETLRVMGLPIDIVFAVFLALLFDPLVVSLAAHHLLDSYMFLFAGLLVYAYAVSFERGFKFSNAVVCGMIAGLGLACKLPFALLVLGILFHCLFTRFRCGRARGGLALLTVALVSCLTIYSLSYVVDILYGGPRLLLEHHFRMAAYMLQAHSPSLATAGNGVLLYMLRLEAWRDAGTLRVTIRVLNETLSPIVEATSLGPQHIGFIMFRPYMANLLLAISPIAALCLLKQDPLALLFGLTHLACLTMLLFGPIWWYYCLPLLTGYLAITYWLSREYCKPTPTLLLLGTLIAWALYALLEYAGIETTLTLG